MVTSERRVYSVVEITEILGLSKTKVWEMIWSGEIPSIKMGTRRLVPKVAFDAWFDAQVQAGS